MIKKIEHLGIAVGDLAQANDLFSRLLGSQPYKEEEVEREKVTTSFFQLGESKLELLGSLDPKGPIGQYLAKKGEGIHHLALEVDDIHAEMERLQKEGFELIHDTPKAGADNKLICFLHPKSTGGVLVELCQENS